ncbi:hypothetical protein F5B20DRAFT_388669 [Whalleya microplaca]|nr:hypothetical protein F5B20DRAFT_388669 [Whalleya microplaca]
MPASRSASIDLDKQLKNLGEPLGDRLKLALGPCCIFNGALLLGVLARESFSQVASYPRGPCCILEMQRNDGRSNQFAFAEVKIVELCIEEARTDVNRVPRYYLGTALVLKYPAISSSFHDWTMATDGCHRATFLYREQPKRAIPGESNI